MRILLVTVTYNGESTLAGFLHSVAQLMAASADQVDIFVADNASSDATREILERSSLGNLMFCPNEGNLGVAKANNQGIRYALEHGYDYVLLVNNDTYLSPHLVNELLSAGQSLGAQLMAPRIDWMGSRNDEWYNGGHIRRALGFLPVHETGRARSSPFITHYASTCCLLVHNRVFREAGLMDERYFVYWDDVDFYLRVSDSGFVTGVHPGITIQHAAGTSTGGKRSPFTIRHYSYGRALLLATHSSPATRPWQCLFLLAWQLGLLLARKDGVAEAAVRLRALASGWHTGRTSDPLTAP